MGVSGVWEGGRLDSIYTGTLSHGGMTRAGREGAVL